MFLWFFLKPTASNPFNILLKYLEEKNQNHQNSWNKKTKSTQKNKCRGGGPKTNQNNNFVRACGSKCAQTTHKAWPSTDTQFGGKTCNQTMFPYDMIMDGRMVTRLSCRILPWTTIKILWKWTLFHVNILKIKNCFTLPKFQLLLSCPLW